MFELVEELVLSQENVLDIHSVNISMWKGNTMNVTIWLV